MTGTLYPTLSRYFETTTELAHAGCMSRQRLYDCLHGIKTFTRAEKKAISANIQAKFTRAEKKAISANIQAKILDRPSFDYKELTEAHEAWKGKFDEIYRRKI